jgi:hypothetical protein
MHACVLIRSPQSFRVAILEGGYSGRYRGAVENFAAAARWGKPYESSGEPAPIGCAAARRMRDERTSRSSGRRVVSDARR